MRSVCSWTFVLTSTTPPGLDAGPYAHAFRPQPLASATTRFRQLKYLVSFRFAYLGTSTCRNGL